MVNNKESNSPTRALRPAKEHIDQALLTEKEALEQGDSKRYLDCVNNKLMRDRKTDMELRQGCILVNTVYAGIKEREHEDSPAP